MTTAAEPKASGTAKGPVPMLHADLFPTYVSLRGADNTHIKNLNYPNFLAELLKQVKTDTSSGKKVRYPFGMVYSNFGINDGLVVIYHPERRVNYQLMDRDGKPRTYNIPLPNMISEIHLGIRDRNYFISTAKIYCTTLAPDVLAARYVRGFTFMKSSGEFKGGTYHVPLTNMYEGGTICFGANSLPSTILDTDLTPLSRPYEILTESPGNHDLSIRGAITSSEFGNKLSGNFYKFFEYWATLEAFPYNNMLEY